MAQNCLIISVIPWPFLVVIPVYFKELFHIWTKTDLNKEKMQFTARGISISSKEKKNDFQWMEKDRRELDRHAKGAGKIREEYSTHWTGVKLFKSTNITSFEEWMSYKLKDNKTAFQFSVQSNPLLYCFCYNGNRFVHWFRYLLSH